MLSVHLWVTWTIRHRWMGRSCRSIDDYIVLFSDDFINLAQVPMIVDWVLFGMPRFDKFTRVSGGFSAKHCCLLQVELMIHVGHVYSYHRVLMVSVFMYSCGQYSSSWTDEVFVTLTAGDFVDYVEGFFNCDFVVVSGRCLPDGHCKCVFFTWPMIN